MFVVFALMSSSLAATRTVDPGSTTAYATVQDAVDASASGDTIDVVAGTYTECIDLDGKDLTITGSGSGTATLDGGGGCAFVLTAEGGEALTLSGFTIENAGARGLYSDVTSMTSFNGGLVLGQRRRRLDGGSLGDGPTRWYRLRRRRALPDHGADVELRRPRCRATPRCGATASTWMSASAAKPSWSST